MPTDAAGQAATEATRNTPTDTESPTDTELASTVRNLLAARDAALIARSAVSLAEVTVPGSPLGAADAALLADLTEAGLQLRGYRTEVLDLTVLSADVGAAAVRAEVQQSAYERLGPTGAVEQVPEQPSQCVRLELGRASADAPWQAIAATAC